VLRQARPVTITTVTESIDRLRNKNRTFDNNPKLFFIPTLLVSERLHCQEHSIQIYNVYSTFFINLSQNALYSWKYQDISKFVHYISKRGQEIKWFLISGDQYPKIVLRSYYLPGICAPLCCLSDQGSMLDSQDFKKGQLGHHLSPAVNDSAKCCTIAT